MESSVLKVENLVVSYRQADSWADALRGVSLQVKRGEIYGLVGESGSGKTTLALAILRYLDPNGKIRGGRISFNEQELTTLTSAQMGVLWGRRLALVPQNPQSALNPSMRVGDQIIEVLRHLNGSDRRTAFDLAIEWLDRVKIADPWRVLRSYPHQISGGMQQRVLIAMAFISTPELLILDEPTTSLDVTTQAAILDMLKELIHHRETSVLYVTHNLGVVAQVCDRVGVLYAGELVEEGTPDQLFSQPLHPYTQGLIGCLPQLEEHKRWQPLYAIPGQIPPISNRPEGCVFGPRCPLAIDICQERPPLFNLAENRYTRCHRWKELLEGKIQAHQLQPEENNQQRTPIAHEDVCLNAKNLTVLFPIPVSPLKRILRCSPRGVHALTQVNLSLKRGNTLGLVGESGSGKTTLARAVMGLVQPTDGSITLFGIALPPDLSRRNRKTLRMLQMVFQNPQEALNPNLTIGQILSRPIRRHSQLSHRESIGRVSELLKAVRLPPEYRHRNPRQLSGGEQQRIAIARALAADPDLVIYDEPLSALDVSVQASILNLIRELQAARNNSLLFISHDLAVVAYLADWVAIIYLGRLLEVSSRSALFRPPFHPYAEALLEAIPMPDPGIKERKLHLQGELPDPRHPPRGCPFYTRCQRRLGEICKEQIPPWQEVPGQEKRIFCHIPIEILSAEQRSLHQPTVQELKSKQEMK